MRSRYKLPPYYSNISLGNFRGFKNVKNIPLAPLTFLVGPNSSGKSSIFDAILLLTQSEVLLTDEPPIIPTWIGSLVDLGSFEDAVFDHRASLTISLALELSLTPTVGDRSRLTSGQKRMTFEFEMRSYKHDPVGNFRSISIRDNTSSERMQMSFAPKPSPKITQEFFGRTFEANLDPQLYGIGFPFADVAGKIERTLDVRRRGLHKGKQASVRANAWRRIASYMRSSDAFTSFIEGTQRVSSGRAAPRRWFSTTTPEELLPNSLRRIFNGVYPAMVDSDRKTLAPFTDEEPINQRIELNKVLKKLNIASAVRASHLSPYHSSIDIKDSVTKITSNIIDVGYGASQVIPVITACLSDRPGPLIIEQPEIHLHPKAQATLADLLCDTSRRRQVLIETHSEHMINRARLQIAKGDLDHRNVMIIYVDRDQRGSRALTIPLKDNGDFARDWPGGFFDERYEDTMALLQLKAKGEHE